MVLLLDVWELDDKTSLAIGCVLLLRTRNNKPQGTSCATTNFYNSQARHNSNSLTIFLLIATKKPAWITSAGHFKRG